MASYAEAVSWIASEYAAGDTPPGMDFDAAFAAVDHNLTVVMVSDLWSKPAWRVALDVLRERGFNVPRGYARLLAAAR
jgi:hypothetical protein